MIKRIFNAISRRLARITPEQTREVKGDELVGTNVQTYSGHQQGIHHRLIAKPALDTVFSLKRAGYDAYLVGGAVRDLMLGIEPKDFDIVTNASPDQVKKVFRHRCQLIGRRFRLAHVRYGRLVIEVATFRGGQDDSDPARQVDESGRLVRDNVYGTMDEDVWRRDFTINALYYDPKRDQVIDYVAGHADLQAGQIALIGDPWVRYREDPVRMIRAVRFAAKLGFNLAPTTEAPIAELGSLLKEVSNARMFDEVLKLFHSGAAIIVFEKLRHYDLFKHLFPLTDDVLATESEHFPRQFVMAALQSTDRRIAEDKPVNPAFLFAAMLWEPMMQARQDYLAEGLSPQDAMYAAAGDVLNIQCSHTAVPKRFTAQIRDIWNLQFRLHKRFGDRAATLRAHPRFRAAYDFIGIRVAAGETELTELFDWWTEYQDKDALEQVRFAHDVKKGAKPRRHKRSNRNFYRKKSDQFNAHD
ncbi:polynucleotide adenylyltransferase PcnB [Thiomicrospira sp. ALE5]|uniref:polynucleotide adenylyltransferase PcnB n=1 Tax=Thiomicrospira sp. ALE5 TaxID=748650 RepID=UPI0008EC84CF|nr:polynucleotide adenylyltransferase PcnB [Thiomicrospira sp. ALE5]SFR53102.1 poly(A) polymerase [Thiomicrospira sp. ALE5]